MYSYSHTRTLSTTAHQRLLVVSAAATSLHLFIGSSVILHMVAGILVAACAVLALFQPDTDTLVRRPPLLAMALLILHVGLGFGAAWLALPVLGTLANASLAALIIGALVVPAVALGVPDERSRRQIGGRTAKQARRYDVLVWVALGAAWLWLALGALVANGVPVAPAVLPAANALLSAVLTVTVWLTWRTRPHDRAMVYSAATAAGLSLAQSITLVTASLFALPMLPVNWGLPLSIALWLALVVLVVLTLRRPVPVAAPKTGATTSEPSLLADYISLTKPKVISLLLVTTLGGMFITGAGLPSLALVFWTLLGGYLAAGGAGAINCAVEKDVDVNMGRTARRPVPSGRIPPLHALVFGLMLSGLSVVVLYTFTTPLATLLSTIGIVYYALFYTRMLKRHTWQNIVIGGGAGSIPPLVGWAAVTGTLTLPAVLLFLIIFYWTPPHFWALALVKEKDYARAGVPMLPVVAGVAETRWQIWLYSWLMVALTLLLVPLQAMGWVYLLLATVLNGYFLYYAWRVWRVGDQPAIWGLYKYSLLYLALLFVAMAVDRLLLV